MLRLDITTFFDPTTSTYSCVVRDPSNRACAIVDPVLNYGPAAGHISHANAERLITHARQHDLQVERLPETHVHAGHLSTAIFLQHELGGRLAIGARITQTQAKFSGLFNLGETFPVDGHQFEHLFEDDRPFRISALECRALHTPGHAPAYMTYLVGDSAFVSGALFIPDCGTARCDFPGGDARRLYRSIQRLFALSDTIRLFIYHDYTAPDRDEHRCEASVDEQRRHNVHVREDVDEKTFVAMRQQRDATLGIPTLMLPAIQVNIRDDNLPPVEGDGVCYLRIPLDLF